MLKITLKTWFAKIVVISTALFAMQSVIANDNASDKLFSDIKANQAKITQDPNYLKNIVRQDLMPYVHVNYAGSLVLGQHFKTTTPEQRSKFFTAFDQFIVQAYAQALTMYKDQKVEIEQPKDVSDSKVSIRVKVIQSGNQAPINLNFYWRKNSKDGKWQVYDMAAEGVSMVDTKKQEWSSILRKDGIDALTEQVQKAANVRVTLNK